MLPHIPWYLTATILTIDVTIVVAVWRLLSRGVERAALAPPAARAVRLGSAAFLGGWLGAVLVLAPAAAAIEARDPFSIAPIIPWSVALSAVGAALAFAAFPSFRRALRAVPASALIGVQTYRVIGAVFLVLFYQGLLPGHFALPAGWGDVAVGLAAPAVALGLAGRWPGARGLAWGWVVLGLGDLVIAVGMGTGLLASVTMGVGRVPPVAAMAAFPLVLVPTFAVPISVLLHLAAAMRLAGDAHLSAAEAETALYGPVRAD